MKKRDYRSYEKEIYVIFYTDLINIKEVVNGEGYSSPFFDIFQNNDSHIFTRITNYISPPFSHCKIALREKGAKHFDSYSFTLKNNFLIIKSDFLKTPGYSVLKIPVTDLQLNLLIKLFDVFVCKSESLTFSTWKMSLIGCHFRYITCSAPVDYPSLKNTNSWTCSEFVTYSLQQIGVLNSNSLHPTYCSPMHLFYEIIFNKKCKIDQCFNPFFTVNKPVSQMHYEQTNAYFTCMDIFGIHDSIDFLNKGKEFMARSYCKIYKIQKDAITLFDTFRELENNGYVIDNNVDVFDNEEVSKIAVELSIPEQKRLKSKEAEKKVDRVLLNRVREDASKPILDDKLPPKGIYNTSKFKPKLSALPV